MNLKKSLILTLVGGVILRIILLPFGNHDDLLVFAEWGRWIYQHSLFGFYQTGFVQSSPTQPPLFNMLLGGLYSFYTFTVGLLLFLKTHFRVIPASVIWWWEKTFFGSTDFLWGYIMSLKLLPILADLGLAALIFKVGQNVSSKSKSLLLTALFLFLPVSWYLSALWGQYDGVMTLLLVTSFLVLDSNFKSSPINLKFALSAILFFLAFQIKPTALVFTPLYIYYFAKKLERFENLILPVISVVLLSLLVTVPFTHKSPLDFTKEVLINKVFFPGRFVMSTRAFNFWNIIFPTQDPLKSSTTILGTLPSYILGYVFMVLIYLWSIVVVAKNQGLRGLLLGLYILSSGSFLFFQGMLDRYFYPSVVILGLLVFYYPKLLKWWLIVAALFFINLFYSWGYPIIEKGDTWRLLPLIWLLSLAQVVVFLKVVFEIGVYKDLKSVIRGSK